MLKLDCSNENTDVAAHGVRNGKVVVYPTDTVYGIGCDPCNDFAVDVIFKIKGRMDGKPLPILCSSLKHAGRIAKLDEKGMKLAEHFWPGALTLIAELLDQRISRKVTTGTCKVGVRVPNHSCASQLIEKCGGVLVGTSANRSGHPTCRSVEDVIKTLSGFDILIDGGKTPHGVESTVVDISDENIVLIREGYISRERIERVFGHV